MTAKNLILNGKLTVADVYSVATQNCRLSIDTSNETEANNINYSFTIPQYLSTIESTSSLLILLNKLLLSNSVSAANQVLTVLEQYRNKDDDSYVINDVGCTDVDFSSCSVIGVSCVINYVCEKLSVLAEAVAAISCEVLGVDLSVFRLVDDGDGMLSKDVVSVASDFRVYFNGSKKVCNLVGKAEDVCVKEIPFVYGSFRKVSRGLRLVTRVYLNSGFTLGADKELVMELLALPRSLSDLGQSSLRRGKMALGKVPSYLSQALGELECPGSEILKELYGETRRAELEDNLVLFVHKVYDLLNAVWKIVSWEGVVAFVALEGSEGFMPDGSVTKSGLGLESEEKKKKKKVVLGKGSLAFMQFIKETLEMGERNGGLAKFAVDFRELLNPEGVGFEGLVKKLKDIIESNETQRIPKIPKGTRDFSMEKMAIREKVKSIITNVFKSHDAVELDTPAFEMRETLMGKYGEDSKLIYDLADQGGELCSLRYDLTVPFARYVAMNNLTSFRRYQIGKVWRRENPACGRSREFVQCDFDIAGQFGKMIPDFEAIKILTELLDKLNIGDYEVKLNHRKLLDGMLAICGVPQAKFRTICSSIDKLDKKEFVQIKKEMVEEKGLTEEAADKIGAFVEQKGSPLELLSKLQEGSEFLQHTESKLALDELELLFKCLDRAKCINKVVFDLSLARGLDYYTGVIFEAVFKGTTQVGSIAGGGRYDNLIGKFGTKQVPAVGISLGIERVFTIMENEKKQEMRATETQVLVCVLFDDKPLACELVSELWKAGVKAGFDANKRMQKHLDRAIKSKIPYMVIVGTEEVKNKIVKLKDLTARTEENVPRDLFVDKVMERLSSPNVES